MLIVNADDWGRTVAETDAALACHRSGRITSVSAMVFMDDSARAAELARDYGIDVGLHLNLSQRYANPSFAGSDAQDKIVRFMTRSKYAVLVYHPALRQNFRDVYQSQMEEFVRLYKQPPSHLDGHQHRHLCMNMLFDAIIARGEKVRRSFSFWSGEKSLLNRVYRRLIDHSLTRKYRVTDYFFSLSQSLETKTLNRVFELAASATVELMTHPVNPNEYAYLGGHEYLKRLSRVRFGTFADLTEAKQYAKQFRGLSCRNS
jgi:predicted glycoside hydrolase/deacetylase ChbG (UPF0249 family)